MYEWEIYEESVEILHVIPLDDARGHVDNCKDEGVSFPYWPPVCQCKCNPKRIKEGERYIIVHSSFDGREGLEWATDILSK